MNGKLPLICITGPTASGKTALSVKLALKLHGEIVSADSMQLYRGIHIASAAPDKSEMRGIPHHLIEILEPEEHFSVADYIVSAAAEIEKIANRGNQPLLVGGTGLYIDSLLTATRFSEEPENTAVREQLLQAADTLGAAEMHQRLEKIDPDAAARLHPNDLRRILRALETYELTGKTSTEWLRTSRLREEPYNSLIIGINFRDRSKLYERINLRVDRMLEKGLEKEALTAFKRTGGGAAQAIGHKELFPYFRGEITLDEAAENLRRATRRYAKRQLTWFRKNERIKWIYADETENALSAAEQLVKEWYENEGKHSG